MKPKQPADNNGRQSKKDALDQAIHRIVKTPSGLLFLRWVMNECGYQSVDTVRQASVSTDGKSVVYGDILPNTIIHNAATRGLWLNIRRRLPRKALIEIEIEEEKPNENPEQI
jgi:hypothetical protein